MQIGSRTTGGLVSVRVSEGGQGYTSAPAIAFSGGGGAGASAVVVMAGTAVDSVIITKAGTGYTGSPTVSFSSGGGTGAAASAYAYTGPLRPMSFFKGRFGELYGVDGMGRGVRWEGGTTVQPIGLHKPAIGPAITASSTAPPRQVASIDILDPGSGYQSAPAVTITGGTPTTPAAGQAVVEGGRVTSIRLTEPGEGYQDTPTVSLTGGLPTGAAFTVGVLGRVRSFDVLERGEDYIWEDEGQPTIDVATSNGLTDFQGRVLIDTARRLYGVDILAAGTGATTTPTFEIKAITGQGGIVRANMLYSVDALTVSNSGQDYLVPPVITFTPDPKDDFHGQGGLIAEVAAATSEVTDGNVSAATVISGGQYGVPPTAVVLDSSASAQATMTAPVAGEYLCCFRYIDDTGKDVGGPLPSSISHLVKVSTGPTGAVLTWTFTHPYLDDRVAGMELWRTSANQQILLFRVATIKRTDGAFNTSYAESTTDSQLTDPNRLGYGLMPITLPSGQINARRFEVPPGQFAVGVMFQDRAWYAVDTSGKAPNSLYYSEVDEPESVPDANELIVQENTGTPDAIVALVPLGPALLVVQRSHIYRLMYVSQPLIDASIMLSAYRGVLNERCWAVMAGVAFLVDSVGMYAFDGNQEQSISIAVDNYWRDGIIDMSKSDKFHVAADYVTKTVRFYYCKTGDTEPVRALCYCTATQAWWEEVYAVAHTATGPVFLAGQLRSVQATSGGEWLKESGFLDSSTPVDYRVRTGNFTLTDSPDRSIDMVYKPTLNQASVSLGLHYNSSDVPRPNAVAVDRGGAFTVAAGGAHAVLQLQKNRPPAGGGQAFQDATGQARAYFSGRKDDRSSGADQHIAVDVSGQQGQDGITLYAIGIRGVQ